MTSVIRVLLLYIPLAWVGGMLFGLQGNFIGATLGNIIAAGIGWYIYKHTQIQDDKRRHEPVPECENVPNIAS